MNWIDKNTFLIDKLLWNMRHSRLIEMLWNLMYSIKSPSE